MSAPDNPLLQSERLVLRRFSHADAAVFFRLNSEPELVQYTARAALTSVDAAMATLDSEQFRHDEKAGLGRFACVEKSTGKVIGVAGLRPEPEYGGYAFGYRILPEHWGQGFATEAATTLLQYGYHQLKLQHIMATVFPQNVASVRVLEKIGLVFEKEVRLAGSTEILWLYQAQQPAATTAAGG
jgi:RimJ/RimL family protein N-acetyltransferase